MNPNTVSNILSFLLVLFVAIIGYLFMDNSSQWYKSLVKPSFNPQDKVFQIVWPILYILLWLSFVFADKTDRKTITLFVLVNILLAAWAPIFFGFKSPNASVVVLIITVIISLIYIITIGQQSILAAVLFLPLFLWLCFATYLSYSIAKLNIKQYN
jgi:tryptophan-rich sensory protein